MHRSCYEKIFAILEKEQKRENKKGQVAKKICTVIFGCRLAFPLLTLTKNTIIKSLNDSNMTKVLSADSTIKTTTYKMAIIQNLQIKIA